MRNPVWNQRKYGVYSLPTMFFVGIACAHGLYFAFHYMFGGVHRPLGAYVGLLLGLLGLTVGLELRFRYMNYHFIKENPRG